MTVAAVRKALSVAHAPRLFGIETEYTFAAFDRRGNRLDAFYVLQPFLDLAKQTLVSLPDRRSAGVFLSNGSRLYIDCGHPELATPEASTPWDLCRYLLAGDRILMQLCTTLKANQPKVADVFVSRSNVSYGRYPTTWGCHESYSHTATGPAVQAGLTPHLASRLILTGAGGFDNRSAGIAFLLSPRVAHLQRSVSDRSTSSRGIFHTKSEPLNSKGYHRLHVICGEGLCSETSTWLKAATTALVLAMVEGGIEPGKAVALKDPLAAMTRFAGDPHGRRMAETASGQRLTAIDVQRHYLELAEKHVDAPFMPDWAPDAVKVWRATLDDVAAGPDTVARTLDWGIKRALFRAHAERSGFAWDELSKWTEVADELRKVLREHQADSDMPVADLTCDVLLADSPVIETVRQLTPQVREFGQSWDRFEGFLKLRSDLFALDTRYSQLGDGGIFATLDRRGVLAHHAPGVDRIDDAATTPPQTGRARLRGETVAAMAKGAKSIVCDWEGVWDYTRKQMLDLDDPFTVEAVWKEFQPESEDATGGQALMMSHLLTRVLRQYDRGQYEDGGSLLDHVRRHREILSAWQRNDLARLTAWIQGRRGQLDGIDALVEIHGDEPESLSILADFVCAFRYRGLRSQEEIAPWIERAERIIAANTSPDPTSTATLRSHAAAHHLRRGRPRKALLMLLDIQRSPEFAALHAHVRSRILGDLGDAYRMLGFRAKAERTLDEADSLQREHNFEGDRAECTLAFRAKLLRDDPAAAVAILSEARGTMIALRNRIGEARLLLLECRLTDDAEVRETARQRLLALRESVPALARCDLFSLILERWTDWISGATPDGVRDWFWNL